MTEIACSFPTKWGFFIGLEKYKRNIEKIIKPSHKSIITMIVLAVIENPVSSCLFNYFLLVFPGLLCKGDWGTRLQENPQLILQLVVMIQLTSRRILRD